MRRTWEDFCEVAKSELAKSAAELARSGENGGSDEYLTQITRRIESAVDFLFAALWTSDGEGIRGMTTVGWQEQERKLREAQRVLLAVPKTAWERLTIRPVDKPSTRDVISAQLLTILDATDLLLDGLGPEQLEPQNPVERHLIEVLEEGRSYVEDARNTLSQCSEDTTAIVESLDALCVALTCLTDLMTYEAEVDEYPPVTRKPKPKK